MTNDYALLNGSGHFEIKGGRLMRMKGFQGLLDAMPSVAPAVSWFTDTTQAFSDYTIENGVVKTDNTYIEGSLFSIKMYGQFDAVADALIVSKLASGMVVVVRQNYVEKAVLENTITQLRYHKANILGFVENYAEDEGGYYQKRYYRKEGYYRKENES
jgi:hypothetical protein